MRGAPRWRSVGLICAFACVAFTSAPLGAQGVLPNLPRITATGSCMAIAGSITCGDPIVHIPPIIVIVPGGDQRGGPLHEEGGLDVDVNRSQRDGRVVMR